MPSKPEGCSGSSLNVNTESSNIKKQKPTLSAALPEAKTQTKASIDDNPLYIILPTKAHASTVYL